MGEIFNIIFNWRQSGGILQNALAKTEAKTNFKFIEILLNNVSCMLEAIRLKSPINYMRTLAK
jgi:hypothetical protein